MEIKQDAQRLAYYKDFPQVLEPMEHSTSSVTGLFIGINFDAEELINSLECCGNIMRIDCNFGHKINKAWETDILVIKSTAKKSKKSSESRKGQGDCSSFNSQISFIIRGSHVCPKSKIGESHKNAIVINLGMNELVTKTYKIKVFCNGAVSIPGVLIEDMADIKWPLDELCGYLTRILLPPKSVRQLMLFPIMKNYKTALKKGGININELQNYCEKHFNNLTNTRMSDIVEFLCCPAFIIDQRKSDDIQPIFNGWNEWFELPAPETLRINGNELRRFITASTKAKNLYVDINVLMSEIKYAGPLLSDIYNRVRIIYEALAARYQHISDNSYQRIIYFAIKQWSINLKSQLVSERDNMLSHFKYDPEKYSGFIIKVKTPRFNNTNKRTTIKIFPSGKINIDGAPSYAYAEFIYWWLNHIFVENPKLIYIASEFNYDDTDSEFSEDSEDSE